MTKTNEILREARGLYDLGFAIHWVMPREKRPVGSGWTIGSRASWKDLEKSFRPDYNVGVRTGTPSVIRGKYLACIDVDIKNKKFEKKALSKLFELTGGAPFPKVSSGSGNGSHHLYCVTDKPFKMVTYAKEKGKWEICIYSEGRQMVLPPSIHPSGSRYAWATPIENGVVPLLNLESGVLEPKPKKKNKGEKGSTTPFEWVCDETLDIRWIPDIADSIRSLITVGLWKGVQVVDRSAYLLIACKGLVDAKLPRDSILTLLTDTTTYLGNCAYDHAQTKNRTSAARWLWRYTLEGVMAQNNPKNVFGEAHVPGKELSEEEMQAQEEELKDNPEARGYYLPGKKEGAIIPDYVSLLEAFNREYPFKTIADMEAVYVFNGTHYVDFTPFEIKGYAESKFNPPPSERIRNEFQSKILSNHIVRKQFFNDSTEGKINFKNGILDLNESSDVLISHTPLIGFRGVLPFAFDKNAQCPLFEEWLRGVMLNDESLVHILQEYMGYIVRGGEYKYHKALWLGGEGRNGKSTFIDVLKALIGPRNYSVISIRDLMGDKFAGSDLDGKIANFSEETSPKELSDSGPFKNITGDGELYAQKKFGDPYTFRNRAKLVMTYNKMPDLSDISKGMLSRPIIVPFEKKIEENEQDRAIKKKLFAELPGIFNFAMRGWERLELQENFTRSFRASQALEMMKAESCNVHQWIEHYVKEVETFDINPQPFTTKDLYEIYCKTERYPHKIREFGKRLAKHPLFKGLGDHKEKGTTYSGIYIL